MNTEEEWTVVTSKRKRRSAPKRNELKERDFLKQSWSALRESTEEMNSDLLPFDRADMSTRPTGTKLGFDVATTSNTLTRHCVFSQEMKPLFPAIERVAMVKGGEHEQDEYGLRSYNLVGERKPIQVYRELPYRYPASYSMNKQKRWTLVDENDEELKRAELQQRVQRTDDGYTLYTQNFVTEVESAPGKLRNAPRLSRTRKGVTVRRGRLPGKQVHSRERNRQLYPEWDRGVYDLGYRPRAHVTRTHLFEDGTYVLRDESSAHEDIELPARDVYRTVDFHYGRYHRRIPRGKRATRLWKEDLSEHHRKKNGEKKNWRAQLV